MGQPRVPGKKYNEGVKRQMSMAWKRAVHAALRKNRLADVAPRNVAELEIAIGAKPSSLNRVLRVDLAPGEKPQMSSKHVGPICEVLGIPLPFVESTVQEVVQLADASAELEGDGDALRRAVMELVGAIHEEISPLPVESQKRLLGHILKLLKEID